MKDELVYGQLKWNKAGEIFMNTDLGQTEFGTVHSPIWEKSNLTLEEAAAYSGIGINKLREISNDERCPFVLWVGSKRLTKRKDFDRYIEQTYSL
jgi:hypothetical protein